MYLTPRETALALAVLLARSKQTRARLSATTIKIVSGGRERLKSAFVVSTAAALADYSWLLVELDTGGYAAIQGKSLEAAKPVTAKKLFSDEERKALRRGIADLARWREEIALPLKEDDEEDDIG